MTTWNNTNPAVGNQIANDIPDILENFLHLKSGLDRLMQETWSDSDLTGIHLDSTVGMYDGTYTYLPPTNSLTSNAILMTGDSNTIAWLYINTAPTGWKAYTTKGTDRILAVSGGTGLYNSNGGTEAGETWANLKAHTHTGPSHNHAWYVNNAADAHDQSYDAAGSLDDLSTAQQKGASRAGIDLVTQGTVVGEDCYTSNAGTGATGAQSTTDVRPQAAVGKLWQLDTA